MNEKKLKTGCYVRNKKGYIAKIKKIDKRDDFGYSIIYFDKAIDKYGWDDGKIHNQTTLNIYDATFKEDAKIISKLSSNILKLLKPQDLLYVDIDNEYAGGIIVPRIPETQNELNKMIELIKNGTWILKDVVTYEQLKNCKYRVI